MPTIEVGDMFVAIVAFSLDGPAQQTGLIDGIVAEIDGWVKHIPGFVSASFHASHDGHRVLNYAQWASRDAYATFGRDDRASAFSPWSVQRRCPRWKPAPFPFRAS